MTRDRVLPRAQDPGQRRSSRCPVSGVHPDIETELGELVTQLAPRLSAEPGSGVLTAAKLLGEIASIGRFATDANLARTARTAPIPASSGRTQRHRLDLGGNRQLNLALRRLPITKSVSDPEIKAYLERRTIEGKTRRESDPTPQTTPRSTRTTAPETR